ncbi:MULTISPECIES: hypothetical protein [Ochrobactrum]|uniref:Uncharacterized protein n=1 Tax=Ochrobactrum chromiisoli TaxID=2993941 RepID=A0ABT3QI77_9HYPH|nr:hypothetical protein [Ochrobactrum chromiisoli]MCX2695311.1 hypothetical protein [Ochrobactrum chromiisoli]
MTKKNRESTDIPSKDILRFDNTYQIDLDTSSYRNGDNRAYITIYSDSAFIGGATVKENQIPLVLSAMSWLNNNNSNLDLLVWTDNTVSDYIFYGFESSVSKKALELPK